MEYQNNEPELEIFAKSATHCYRYTGGHSPICDDCGECACFPNDTVICGYKQKILINNYICQKCNSNYSSKQRKNRNEKIIAIKKQKYDTILENNVKCKYVFNCDGEPNILDECLIYDEIVCDKCSNLLGLTEKYFKIINVSSDNPYIYIDIHKSKNKLKNNKICDSDYKFLCPNCKSKYSIKYHKNHDGQKLYVKCNRVYEKGTIGLKNTYKN